MANQSQKHGTVVMVWDLWLPPNMVKKQEGTHTL